MPLTPPLHRRRCNCRSLQYLQPTYRISVGRECKAQSANPRCKYMLCNTEMHKIIMITSQRYRKALLCNNTNGPAHYMSCSTYPLSNSWLCSMHLICQNTWYVDRSADGRMQQLIHVFSWYILYMIHLAYG